MIEHLSEKDLYLHRDYIYTRKLNLDIEQQKSTALIMQDLILQNFANEDCSGQKTLTTKLFMKYNYLMHPLPGIHKLYSEIKRMFYDVHDVQEEHFIQCWINFYNSGEYIDWHGHWPLHMNSWHGFYCLDVEPDSYTEYRIDGIPFGFPRELLDKIPKDSFPKQKYVTVKSENNLLVLSRSGRDCHRSSEWKKETPRITIAFDIVPAEKLISENYIKHQNSINHWIPI
jgi:hypothetical protein